LRILWSLRLFSTDGRRPKKSSQAYRPGDARTALTGLPRVTNLVGLAKHPPPRRVSQRPPELTFRLGVRGSSGLRHESDAGLARGDPPEPARYLARRLRADRLRERWQPLADGGGLVVDDVVDPR